MRLLLLAACLLLAPPAVAQTRLLHEGPSLLSDGDLAVFSPADWEPVRARLGLPPSATADFGSEWMLVSSRGGAMKVAAVERESARRRRLWEWTVSFGPSRTDYLPGTVVLDAPGASAEIRGLKPVERHSMEYWDLSRPNPFQALDEPTNGLFVRAENPEKGWALVFSLFHPKMLMTGAEGRARGTLDGRAVDGDIRLDDYFSTYRLTRGFVRFGAGVERFWTVASGRLGSLTYGVGVSPQLYAGYAMVALKSEGDPDLPEGKMGIIGAGVGVTQRLTYEFPKSPVFVSVTEGLDAARLKYPFHGGVATQDLGMHTVNLGVGTRIAPRGRRRRPLVEP